MRLFELISLGFLPLTLAASSASTFTIAYEPLTATATPVPLAVLTSTPPSQNNGVSTPQLHPAYSLTSYTSPKASAKDITPLLRIGVLDGKTLIGSTTLTSLDALSNPDIGLLEIVIDKAGEVWGASWHRTPLYSPQAEGAAAKTEGKSKNTQEKGKPALLVSSPGPEPRPVLNKPVVLNEQGKVDETEQPKTLLQKYWWVGVALLVMTLAGGGGE